MYVVFAVSAALILVWAVFVFNRLVRWRNLVGEAWSGVDVQLKRRYDLIPALLEAVREYTAHERELFADVARLRVRAIDAAPPEQSAAENALSGGLRSLFAVAERYPEIKASKNYLDLQENLAEVEDQIQLARRYYNGAVRNYNNLVQSFPGMIVARLAGFGAAGFFEIERATERVTPAVEL